MRGRRSCRLRSCAGRADHDGDAASHVFATVVAGAFDDSHRTAVADAEAFAGATAEERLPAGRAVEGDVADQDVVLGDERAVLGGNTMILPPDSPLPT